MRQRMTEAYMAEHLWLLTGAVYALAGQSLGTSRYTDMLYPSKASQDTRTAEEIKQDILKRLVT